MGQLSKPSARRASMKVAAARAVLLWATMRRSVREPKLGTARNRESRRASPRLSGPRSPKGPVV